MRPGCESILRDVSKRVSAFGANSRHTASELERLSNGELQHLTGSPTHKLRLIIPGSFVISGNTGAPH